MVSIPTCECGVKEQSANHIIASCPNHHPLHGALGISHLIKLRPGFTKNGPLSEDIIIQYLLHTKNHVLCTFSPSSRSKACLLIIIMIILFVKPIILSFLSFCVHRLQDLIAVLFSAYVHHISSLHSLLLL